MKNTKTFNVEEFVKQDIELIWEKYQKYGFTKYSPVTVKGLLSNSIVFIGLNPSIPRNFEENDSLRLDTYDHNPKHRYFCKFADIADKLKQNWGHVDLLYVRNTNQKNIKEMLSNEKDPQFNFIKDQLEVTKKLIESIISQTSPILFVVNNALARKIFFKENPYSASNPIGDTFKFSWDDKIGTFIYNDIPFYFTGMLTGRRALDIGSYDRLVWQLSLYLDKLNTSQSLQI